ncbi:ABC transporter substrate-binding protein [Halomonas sp. SpR8]|uniref:ABC transporter substrate-binding protein n=1 Tax=Halomonas sp. SpR8 TaxID=3050463 RepID=UPI0027E518E8|nr:ABC transporter substrate-binding protein [Halomonas sp. SpR8]MDQ7727783.1 ABC transporter substrate-binding protein [Halomonas sp. SpR8]
MQRLRSLLIAIPVMTILNTGGVLAHDFPLTIVDDRNKSVEIAQLPRTVASISSFGADVLVSLGRQVDGLSILGGQQSDFLGGAAVDAVNLGEVHQTNLEVLAQLSPDLTIGLRTYTEPFEQKIEEAGAFLAFDLITLEDSLRSVERATLALGAESQGSELNERFLNDLERHAERAPGGISAVFLWHWGDVPYAFYSHHLTGHIMTQLGATNIQGNPPRGMAPADSSAISMETLLRLNPDVILSFKADDGPFVSHPAWPRLKAVRNNRAWRVGDQYVMPHGPLARQMVLKEMAYLLYPDHFPAPKDIPEPAQARAMNFER